MLTNSHLTNNLDDDGAYALHLMCSCASQEMSQTRNGNVATHLQHYLMSCIIFCKIVVNCKTTKTTTLLQLLQHKMFIHKSLTHGGFYLVNTPQQSISTQPR